MQKFYDRTLNWLITFGPKLALAVFLFIVGLWLIRKFKKLVNRLLVKRRIDPSLRPFLTGTLSVIMQVLLLFAVMQIVGIQLTVFAALVGAFGVAAGLALSGTLQNFTSGILILILKPFRVGDNIVAQSLEGTVKSITIFYTIVTTFDNRTVIFPNSKLSNEVIVNLSREGRRRMDIEITFPYDLPFSKLRSVIETALKDNTDILSEPVVRVGIISMDEKGYKVLVNAWSKAHGYLDAKLKVYEIIGNAITEAGIKMPA